MLYVLVEIIQNINTKYDYCLVTAQFSKKNEQNSNRTKNIEQSNTYYYCDIYTKALWKIIHGFKYY